MNTSFALAAALALALPLDLTLVPEALDHDEVFRVKLTPASWLV